jgi:hypothetical protein
VFAAVMVGIALSLAVLASPASAATGKVHLSDAVVSPRTGTPATTFTFLVRYSHDDGMAAEWVKVTIGTKTHGTKLQSGGDWKNGRTFSWSGSISVGTFAVTFFARSKDHKDEASLAVGTISVSKNGAPTPAPTPRPTPTSTATPASTARPAPTSTPTPRPTPTATPHPTPTPKPRPTPTPSVPPSAAATIPSFEVSLWRRWAREPSATAQAIVVVPGRKTSDPPAATGAGPAIDTGAGTDDAESAEHASPVAAIARSHHAGRSWSPLDGLLAATSLTVPTFVELGVASTLVTTTGVATFAMAFGLFGRRRRDGEPPAPDEVLAAAAATGVGTAAMDAALVLVAQESSTTQAGLTAQQEALLPRWRRPSLLEARKGGPIPDSTPVPRLTFGKALVGRLRGHERRLIRYRVVRLLDEPDELSANDIGFLDQDDEVQLLEKRGAYWLVLRRDGRQGWLHNVTLGDVVDDGPEDDGPMATMPIAADSWTLGDADAGSDLLDAYLAARRRLD